MTTLASGKLLKSTRSRNSSKIDNASLKLRTKRNGRSNGEYTLSTTGVLWCMASNSITGQVGRNSAIWVSPVVVTLKNTTDTLLKMLRKLDRKELELRLEIIQKAHPPHQPWGIGSRKNDFLDAVEALLSIPQMILHPALFWCPIMWTELCGTELTIISNDL